MNTKSVVLILVIVSSGCHQNQSSVSTAPLAQPKEPVSQATDPKYGLVIAGSSLAAPLYRTWGEESGLLRKPGTKQTIDKADRLEYLSVGSDQGMKRLSEGRADAAATDWPMFFDDSCFEKQDHTNQSTYAQMPTVIGGVAVIYNLPNFPSMQFSPTVLASIFEGDIKRWNDERIKGDNPDAVNLPSTAITVVHRSDGSGTSRVFTEFLSKHSDSWKSRIAGSKDPMKIDWPVGLGAKGSKEMAGLVGADNAQGYIGYVEDYYVEPDNIDYQEDPSSKPSVSIGLVKNIRGEYIPSGLDGIGKSGMKFAKRSNLDQLGTTPKAKECGIIDNDQQGAYPISTFTWLVWPTSIRDHSKALLCRLLKYGMDAGQREAPGKGYGALPGLVRNKNMDSIADECD